MTDAIISEILKTCKAGVVSNEGPGFKLEVKDVPVPKPGKPTMYKPFHNV
jgi:propanol-preferring alcohol dehydrogenase